MKQSNRPANDSTPRGPLSRSRILRAALQLLDAEGAGALTMRRIGAELGVEAMSLYRYLPNKAALLDGLHETILGELRVLPRKGEWIELTRSHAHAFRAVLRAHPNALPLFATRAAVTPASLRHVERALTILREAGFAIDDAISAFQAITTFVVGHTLSTDTAPSEDCSPVSYADLNPLEFPVLHQAAAVMALHSTKSEFEFGLDALLRGLEKKRRISLCKKKG